MCVAPYVDVLQEAEAQARRELEAIIADSSQSEEARKRAKDALRKQHEEMLVSCEACCVVGCEACCVVSCETG